MLQVVHIAYVAPGIRRVTVAGTASRATEALWTAGSARKPHTCVRCTLDIDVGRLAFRPVRDTDYRMRRLCGMCADLAEPGKPWSYAETIAGVRRSRDET